MAAKTGKRPKRRPPARRRRRKAPARRSRVDVEARYDAFADAYTDPSKPTFCNGKKSAIAAGFSARSAASKASQLLTDVKVQARIQVRLRRAAEEAHFTRRDFIDASMKQANSWLDELGGPKHQVLVNAGEVVVWKKKPVLEQWRPNETNRRALEMAGMAAGHIGRSASFGVTGEPGGGIAPGGSAAVASAGVVNNIYIGAELPPTRRPARLDEVK